MGPKTFLVFQNSLPMDGKPWRQTSFIVALLPVTWLDVLCPVAFFFFLYLDNNRTFMIWNVPLTASDSSVTVRICELRHIHAVSSLQAAYVWYISPQCDCSFLCRVKQDSHILCWREKCVVSQWRLKMSLFFLHIISLACSCVFGTGVKMWVVRRT